MSREFFAHDRIELFQQLPVASIPVLRELRRGIDDVHEQHRSEDSVGFCTVTATGNKLFDFVEDRVRVADPWKVIATRHLDHSGALDVLRQVATSGYGGCSVVLAMDDERWDLHRRENTPDVGVTRHGDDLPDRARAYCAPLEPPPTANEGFVIRAGRRVNFCCDALAPLCLEALEEPVPLDTRQRPGVVLGPQARGKGVAQHEPGCSARMRCGKENTHRATFGDPEQEGAFRSRRIENGPQVVHPLVERWKPIDRIGKSGASPIQQDQPRKA